MRIINSGIVFIISFFGLTAVAWAGCPSHTFFDPVEVVSASSTHIKVELDALGCGGTPTEQHFLVWVHDEEGASYGGTTVPVGQTHGDQLFPALFWFPDEPLPSGRSYRLEILPFGSAVYTESATWPSRPSQVFKVVPNRLVAPESLEMVTSIESDLVVDIIETENCCQTSAGSLDQQCWVDETRFEPVLEYDVELADGFAGNVLLRPHEGRGAGDWYAADSFRERAYLRRLNYEPDQTLPACTRVDVIHQYYGLRQTVEICTPDKKFVSEPVKHPRPTTCYTPPEFSREFRVAQIPALQHGYPAALQVEETPDEHVEGRSCATGAGANPWLSLIIALFWGVRRRMARLDD